MTRSSGLSISNPNKSTSIFAKYDSSKCHIYTGTTNDVDSAHPQRSCRDHPFSEYLKLFEILPESSYRINIFKNQVIQRDEGTKNLTE